MRRNGARLLWAEVVRELPARGHVVQEALHRVRADLAGDRHLAERAEDERRRGRRRRSRGRGERQVLCRRSSTGGPGGGARRRARSLSRGLSPFASAGRVAAGCRRAERPRRREQRGEDGRVAAEGAGVGGKPVRAVLQDEHDVRRRRRRRRGDRSGPGRARDSAAFAGGKGNAAVPG